MSTDENSPYQIVQFTDKSKKGVTDFDIVPSQWVHFDNSRGTCVTKYMSGPYTDARCKMLQKLIAAAKKAPTDWPVYAVQIKAQSKAYEDALLQLKQVRQSFDDETNAKDVTASSQVSTIRHSKRRTDEVLSVPEFRPDEDLFDGKHDSSLEISLESNHSGPSRKSPEAVKANKATGSKVLKEPERGAKAKERTPAKKSVDFYPKEPMDLDVLDISSLDCLALGNNDYGELLQIVKSIEVEVRNNTREIRKLATIIHEAQGAKSSKYTFADKYKLEQPLKTLEEFGEFDAKLSTERECWTDYVQCLKLSLDRDGIISRSITAMLKKFLSRDLALRFTASKQATGKIIFWSTAVCKCIFEALQHEDPNKPAVSEGIVKTQLSHVLCNVKDWDGLRKARKNVAAKAP